MTGEGLKESPNVSVKLDFKWGTVAVAAFVVDALGAARIDELDAALDLMSELDPLENQSFK